MSSFIAIDEMIVVSGSTHESRYQRPQPYLAIFLDQGKHERHKTRLTELYPQKCEDGRRENPKNHARFNLARSRVCIFPGEEEVGKGIEPQFGGDQGNGPKYNYY